MRPLEGAYTVCIYLICSPVIHNKNCVPPVMVTLKFGCLETGIMEEIRALAHSGSSKLYLFTKTYHDENNKQVAYSSGTKNLF